MKAITEEQAKAAAEEWERTLLAATARKLVADVERAFGPCSARTIPSMLRLSTDRRRREDAELAVRMQTAQSVPLRIAATATFNDAAACGEEG